MHFSSDFLRQMLSVRINSTIFHCITDCSLSYRVLRSFFSETQYWRNHDPFFALKMDALKKSRTSIYRSYQLTNLQLHCSFGYQEIATTMHELEQSKSLLTSDPDKMRVLFKEITQICLWSV
jgi:damage-control phosphatase, subfamily III